jgi:hypothetical protein
VNPRKIGKNRPISVPEMGKKVNPSPLKVLYLFYFQSRSIGYFFGKLSKAKTKGNDGPETEKSVVGSVIPVKVQDISRVIRSYYV